MNSILSDIYTDASDNCCSNFLNSLIAGGLHVDTGFLAQKKIFPHNPWFDNDCKVATTACKVWANDILNATL